MTKSSNKTAPSWRSKGGLTYLGHGNPLGKGQPRPSLVIIRNRLKPPFSKPKLTDLAEKPSPEGEE